MVIYFWLSLVLVAAPGIFRCGAQAPERVGFVVAALSLSSYGVQAQ